MRPALTTLLESLLERSRREGGIHIDDFGDAVTPHGVSPAEIEELIGAFEDRGGVLHAPSGGGHAERLKVVLAAARELAPLLGRPATPQEIATHAKMDLALVRAALAVGRVMGR
jgi:hypothetical protein